MAWSISFFVEKGSERDVGLYLCGRGDFEEFVAEVRTEGLADVGGRRRGARSSHYYSTQMDDEMLCFEPCIHMRVPSPHT
jgi:hypothetical protein